MTPQPPSPLRRAGLLLALALAGAAALFQLAAFLLRRAPEPIGSRADLFVAGGRATLLLTLAAGALGLLIGLAAGLAKLSRRPLLRRGGDLFVWGVRGTPLLVQILFVYYALPALVPALRLGEFTAAVLALAANVGAYNAEAVRAGVLAVPAGQVEAARSLGLSSRQAMRWVVLPQAVRIVIPPLVNNLVGLLKDSSLASSIGLLELTLAGNRISSETFLPVPVLATVAAIYLALTTLLTALTTALERLLR